MSICRNPTVVCRVTRNVEEDMQAKATERSRFLTWEERNFPRRTPTPFFVCVRLSSLFHHPPPPTNPAISCWFPAKHVCRALYALLSLACRCLPRFDAAAVTRQQRVGAAAFFCSSHAANPEIADVCVRGYQPGLTPAKHCEGKRFSWTSDANGARTSHTLPSNIFCFLSLQACEHTHVLQRMLRERVLFYAASAIFGAFRSTVCVAGQKCHASFMRAHTRFVACLDARPSQTNRAWSLSC